MTNNEGRKQGQARGTGRAGWIILIIVLLAVLIAGGAAIWKQMSRVSQEPPVLTLEGENTVQVADGEKYKEPGYQAVDATGHDITDQVKIDMPDMKDYGTYTIKYSVADKQGNKAYSQRTVERTRPRQTKAGRERGLMVLRYSDVYDGTHAPALADRTDDMIANEVLDHEMAYFDEEDYYFPTWTEVRQYLDGKIDLPEKSILLTFDYATDGFVTYGAPVLEKYDVKATVFAVTSRNGEKLKDAKYKHIDIQSATDDLYDKDLTKVSQDALESDLRASIAAIGSHDALVYPGGHYNDQAEKAAENCDFSVAFTMKEGIIHPGDDPYALKRTIVKGNMTMYSFQRMVEQQ